MFILLFVINLVPFISCQRNKEICPPLKSTDSTYVQCKYRGESINCSEAVHLTTAQFSCAPFHKLQGRQHVSYCTHGSWEFPTPLCEPVCGQKPDRINTSRGKFPWTIGIYRKYDERFILICAGTLISEKLIITAAHCLSDRDGRKRDESLYTVAAGKYYSSYNDRRDTNEEYSEVEKIFIPGYYKGVIRDFEADIAVLVTRKSFNMTENIQRICIDWDRNSEYESNLLGEDGIVTGWGFNVLEKKESEMVKQVTLPYVNLEQCFMDMPDNFKRYVRSDKICAGYLNKGIGVCAGDSGGGLFFENSSDSRYYLRAVVSVSPQSPESCDANNYAISTKISSYIDFLSAIKLAYR